MCLYLSLHICLSACLCIYVCLSVCLYIHPSVYRYNCLSVSIYLSVCLSVYLSVCIICVPVCLSIYSICLFVWSLSVCLNIRLFLSSNPSVPLNICLSVSVFIYLSVSLYKIYNIYITVCLSLFICFTSLCIYMCLCVCVLSCAWGYMPPSHRVTGSRPRGHTCLSPHSELSGFICSAVHCMSFWSSPFPAFWMTQSLSQERKRWLKKSCVLRHCPATDHNTIAFTRFLFHAFRLYIISAREVPFLGSHVLCSFEKLSL